QVNKTPRPQVNTPREFARAQQLIREALRYGDVPAKEVYAKAKTEGISTATLERAKEGLARSYRNPAVRKRPWYWGLLEDEVLRSVDDDVVVVSRTSSSSSST